MVANNGKIRNDIHIAMNIPIKNKANNKNTKIFGRNFSLTIVEKKIALYNKLIFRV